MSIFHGLRLWSFQMRATVSLPMPKRLAMSRVVQWVEPSSGDCVQGVVDDGCHRALGQPRPPAPTLGDPTDAVDTLALEPPPPGPHRVVGRVAAPGHFVVAHAVGRQQQRLGLDHLAMPERRRTRHRLEGRSLFVGHGQRGCGGHHVHGATLAIRAISATDHWIVGVPLTPSPKRRGLGTCNRMWFRPKSGDRSAFSSKKEVTNKGPMELDNHCRICYCACAGECSTPDLQGGFR